MSTLQKWKTNIALQNHIMYYLKNCCENQLGACGVSANNGRVSWHIFDSKKAL